MACSSRRVYNYNSMRVSVNNFTVWLQNDPIRGTIVWSVLYNPWKNSTIFWGGGGRGGGGQNSFFRKKPTSYFYSFKLQSLLIFAGSDTDAMLLNIANSNRYVNMQREFKISNNQILETIQFMNLLCRLKEYWFFLDGRKSSKFLEIKR